MGKVLGPGNMKAVREGVRETVVRGMMRFVEEVGKVGDIRDIQLPLYPSLAHILSRKWTKGGSLASFHPSPSPPLEVLLVRLSSLVYFQSELTQTLSHLYESHTPEVLQPINSLIKANIDSLCDYTACRVVNVELYEEVFKGLYRQGDLSSRVGSMVGTFRMMMKKCPQELFGSLLSRCLDCFASLWSRLLLEVDPSTPSLRDTFMSDLESVQHFFEARQHSGPILGLEKSLQAVYLTPVTELMSLVLKSEEALLEVFKAGEATKQQRMWIVYLFYYRQRKGGLEVVAQNKQLIA